MSDRFCLFVRFWPLFFPDSDFPFKRFNSLPDAEIDGAIETYLQKNHKALRLDEKLAAALERRSKQCISDPSSDPSLGERCYKPRIESLSWKGLKLEALQVGVKIKGTKEQLTEKVYQAAAACVVRRRAEFMRDGKLVRAPGADGFCLFDDGKPAVSPKPVQLEGPLILRFARVAGWRRLVLRYGNSPASCRVPFRLTTTREEAEHVAKRLQAYFRKYDLCPQFAVLPAREFFANAAEEDAFVRQILEATTGTEATEYGAQLVRQIIKAAEEFASGFVEDSGTGANATQVPAGAEIPPKPKTAKKPGRPRKGTDEADDKLEAAFRASGLSQGVFAEREGHNPSHLKHVVDRVQKRQKRATK